MSNVKKNGNVISSFKTAWKAFRNVLLKEASFKYMLVIALLVTILMFYFPLGRVERLSILLIIILVLLLDLINSCLERVLDYIQPKYDIKVKEIKDLLSAIVLIGCIGAVIIGLVVFWPYIF